MDSERSPPRVKLPGLHLLSSFVTGAGTQRRTGVLVEMRAGIIGKNTKRMKVGKAGYYSTTILYRPPREGHVEEYNWQKVDI